VSLLLFFFLSTWPHFDDDEMTKRKKKLKIETSIISVYLHSCNPIVASEKTPKRLKTQSSLFSPFPGFVDDDEDDAEISVAAEQRSRESEQEKKRV